MCRTVDAPVPGIVPRLRQKRTVKGSARGEGGAGETLKEARRRSKALSFLCRHPCGCSRPRIYSLLSGEDVTFQLSTCGLGESTKRWRRGSFLFWRDRSEHGEEDRDAVMIGMKAVRGGGAINEAKPAIFSDAS